MTLSNAVQLANAEKRPLAAFWVHKELQRLLAAEEADRLRLWDLGALCRALRRPAREACENTRRNCMNISFGPPPVR